MSKMIRTIGLAFMALAASCAPSIAQEYSSRSLKFATTTPDGAPTVVGMHKFAELVEERSGGKLKIQLFPGGTLGGDVQVISALQGGLVEMTLLNAGILQSQSPDFAILDFPFLFTDASKADAVMDGEPGQYLAGLLPQHGLVGLAYWELGFRTLTNNVRPVKTADDIAGLKLRTLQSPIFVDVFSTLGANPVPLPFPEVYGALETGTVDGQENPATLILSSSFQDVQKYLSLTRHVYNPQIVLFSKRVWDQLTEDDRKLLTDTAMEVRLEQRQLSRDGESKALEELAQAGMEINELDDGQVAVIQEKIRPILDRYAANISPTLVEQVFSTVGAN